MITTVQLNNETKEMLDKIKIHERESYNDVIFRIIAETKTQNIDEDNLKETVEILSDPETLRDIADALDEYKQGKGKSLKQIEKELKL